MTKRIEKPDAEVADDYILEFKLRKPIQAYGEEISVLKLRRPTGADVLKVGNPVKFYPHTDPVQVEHDYPKVVAMVALLARVPSSSLTALTPSELADIAWDISPFFLPGR